MSIFKITCEDIARQFNDNLSNFPAESIKSLENSETFVMHASVAALEEYCLYVMKLIHSKDIYRNANDNLEAWERGWAENLAELKAGGDIEEVLKPKYFRGSKFLRYNKALVVSENVQLEYDLFTAIRYYLFEKYLKSFNNIFEFGCGSCQNVLMLSQLYPHKMIRGLDWAASAVAIANQIGEQFQCDVKGIQFNMLKPDYSVHLPEESAIITIHALEQIGSNHNALIDYWIASKPKLVVNYEPVLEMYDAENMMDYLAIQYSKKRDYLNGFYTALLEREKKGEIEIITALRPNIGGVIHEASLLVWRPT